MLLLKSDLMWEIVCLSLERSTHNEYCRESEANASDKHRVLTTHSLSVRSNEDQNQKNTFRQTE